MLRTEAPRRYRRWAAVRFALDRTRASTYDSNKRLNGHIDETG